MANGDAKELGVELSALDAEQGDNPDMTGVHVPVASMGTAYDRRDMRVMGKLQELRVSTLFSIRSAQSLTTSAKFPFYLNSRLCLHTYEYLGDCPCIDGFCS
jgi:hypothetical protein